MSALLFLFIALVLSGIGSAVLVLRTRRPTSVESGIDEFRREMNALAPPDQPRDARQPDRKPPPADSDADAPETDDDALADVADHRTDREPNSDRTEASAADASPADPSPAEPQSSELLNPPPDDRETL